MRLALAFLALAAAAALSAGGIYLLSIVTRPPMPLDFGQRIWDYECAFTVTRVARMPRIRTLTARGEFYIVSARVDCPYGERYRWDNSRAYVVDNDGRRYDFSPGGQAAFDAASGQSSAPHTILGAARTEHLVFDLPKNVPQPALLFADTVGAEAFFGNWRTGRIYEPHRFNLRYE